ncbi:MAG: hypothetical protein JW993_02910 [Sedimentisphaerales bacterium]|nr:hypothetical protein [Sedimentisphaerales bacterium]
MSNKQIAKALLKKPLSPQEQERVTARRALLLVLPHYDNLTLFALSMALLLLVLTGSITVKIPEPLTVDSSLPEVFVALAGQLLTGFAGLFGLAAIGMIVSLFGVFLRGPKPQPLKFLMLAFAVLATGGTGIYAGMAILEGVHSWPMMIFPLWNIVSGITLLFLFRTGLMDPDCVLDRRPSGWQVIVTLVSISLLLAICRYALHLHWAITYSICVCYALSFNHTLQEWFGPQEEPLAALEELGLSEDGRQMTADRSWFGASTSDQTSSRGRGGGRACPRRSGPAPG